MVKLDKNEFEEGIGIIRQSANEAVLDQITKLASVIGQEGDNAMKNSLLEQCKKYQTVYNETFKPAIDRLLGVFNEAFDYTEHMEKESVSELRTTDAGFETKALNPQSVNI